MSSTLDGSMYFCCCNRIHVRSATCFIGVSEILVACAFLLLATFEYAKTRLMPLQFSVIVFVFFIQFVSSVTTLYAVREANPVLLLTTIVVRCVFASAAVFYFALTLIALALKGEFAREVFAQPIENGGVYFFDELTKWQLTLIVAIVLTAIMAQIWFLDVVRKCYDYLRDRARFSEALKAAENIGPLLSDGSDG